MSMDWLPDPQALSPYLITRAIEQKDVVALLGSLLSYVQLALLVIILLAGLRWMFSFGDETKVAAARKAIWAALIGYVIIYFSYAIVAGVTGFLKGL